MRKLLKDYPRDEWMEAADGCESCGAKYQVKVSWVDDAGIFGDVVARVEHREDCPKRYDEWTGEDVETEEVIDVAGWEYMEEPHTLLGREYYPLKSRANIGPCLECGRLVIGVPLILFIDQGRGGQLDFCFECAEKLGILRALTGGNVK